MRCDQFERRLNERLDRRLPADGDAQLATHAYHCPQCHALLASGRALDEVFGEQTVPPISLSAAGFTRRVLARVVVPSHPRKRLALAAAAAALFAVIVAQLPLNSEHLARSPEELPVATFDELTEVLPEADQIFRDTVVIHDDEDSDDARVGAVLQQIVASVEDLDEADADDGVEASSDVAIFALVEAFSDVFRPIIDSSGSAVEFMVDLWASAAESTTLPQQVEQPVAEGT